MAKRAARQAVLPEDSVAPIEWAAPEEVLLMNEVAPKPEVVALEASVELRNMGDVPQYVPLASGMVRLGPKAFETVRVSEVTDATRQILGATQVVIRNQ